MRRKAKSKQPILKSTKHTRRKSGYLRVDRLGQEKKNNTKRHNENHQT